MTDNSIAFFPSRAAAVARILNDGLDNEETRSMAVELLRGVEATAATRIKLLELRDALMLAWDNAGQQPVYLSDLDALNIKSPPVK